MICISDYPRVNFQFLFIYCVAGKLQVCSIAKKSAIFGRYQSFPCKLNSELQNIPLCLKDEDRWKLEVFIYI